MPRARSRRSAAAAPRRRGDRDRRRAARTSRPRRRRSSTAPLPPRDADERVPAVRLDLNAVAARPTTTRPCQRLLSPTKPATKAVRGRVVKLLRRADLLELAGIHHRDLVRHDERFRLVVRDVDEGRRELMLQQLQLDLHALAQLQVERAERLVEQQHVRLEHHAARDRDALLLAAGELADVLARRRPGSPMRSSTSCDLARDLAPWQRRGSAARRRCSRRHSSSGTAPGAGTPS